jgi:hypothetical protein
MRGAMPPTPPIRLNGMVLSQALEQLYLYLYHMTLSNLTNNSGVEGFNLQARTHIAMGCQ